MALYQSVRPWRIDWLAQANAAVPAGEDCGYQAFMASFVELGLLPPDDVVTPGIFVQRVVLVDPAPVPAAR